MAEPLVGEQAICGMCHERIVFVGPYWDHITSGMEAKPRHPAIPEDEWKPAPLTKDQAFNAFLAALNAAGIQNTTPIIEALYVYREALLKWQRELMDQHAWDAELAIRVLRSYTRKEPE